MGDWGAEGSKNNQGGSSSVPSHVGLVICGINDADAVNKDLRELNWRLEMKDGVGYKVKAFPFRLLAPIPDVVKPI